MRHLIAKKGYWKDPNGFFHNASNDDQAATLNRVCASVTAAHLLTSLAPCSADPAPIIHYAPGKNLEHVDVALSDRESLDYSNKK